jgi:hypothetical protein
MAEVEDQDLTAVEFAVLTAISKSMRAANSVFSMACVEKRDCPRPS